MKMPRKLRRRGGQPEREKNMAALQKDNKSFIIFFHVEADVCSSIPIQET